MEHQTTLKTEEPAEKETSEDDIELIDTEDQVFKRWFEEQMAKQKSRSASG